MRTYSCINRIRFRITAILLCLALLAGLAGCAKDTAGAPAPAAAPAVTTESPAESTPAAGDLRTEPEPPPEIEAPAPEKITDQGAPIRDFDAFANGAWYAEHADFEGERAHASDALYKTVGERLLDILENTDPETLSPEEGLYKAVTFYQQLLTEDTEQRIETIKKHLAPIGKVKTLQDLYDLLGTEEYGFLDRIWNFQVSPDDNGYNTLFFRPDSYCDIISYRYGSITSDTETETGKAFLDYMALLGYSKERTIEMLENAKVVADIVEAYWEKHEGSEYTYYFSQKKLEEAGVTVPVTQILEKHGGLGCAEAFLAEEGVPDLFKELYTKENLPCLRDHLLLAAANIFSGVSGTELPTLDSAITSRELAYQITYAMTQDVLFDEYNARYLDEKLLEGVQSLVEDVKLSARTIVMDSEWLTVHGKELARRKILRMHFYYGENQSKNDLSEVTLPVDPVESYVSLFLNKARFNRSQIWKEDEEREIFGRDMSDVNAYYYAEYNSVLLMAGLLSHPLCKAESAYEERLAVLGHCIAHEISHSYDPRGSNYVWDGYFEPWMTEEEAAAYKERTDRIAAFFDGIETEYGKTIDGDLVKQETFADLMATECCLRMLAQKQDADYDLFFRTLASQIACTYTEAGMENAVANEHLPAKERINYILGQFEQFYETYDIDEDSPFYVPEEKRLPVF